MGALPSMSPRPAWTTRIHFRGKRSGALVTLIGNAITVLICRQEIDGVL